MLFVSTVIRLLIFPTRLDASPLSCDDDDDAAAGAGVAGVGVSEVGATVPRAEACFLPSDISDATRVASLPSPLLPPSEVVALSGGGVEARVTEVLVLLAAVLALLPPDAGELSGFSTNLIRRECSNTSWVIIPSMRTREPVCAQLERENEDGGKKKRRTVIKIYH